MSIISVKELYDFVEDLESRIKKNCDSALLEELAISKKYSIGSSSEFFGEVRLVLQKIISSSPIDENIRKEVNIVISEINEEFRRVNNGRE